ncbi:hypothetical protein ACFW2V_12855 [Streptomyces sp. NPDC058947]|uniref:hypothetical protein n=1 Tax=Streptomyces sp. NPDC058947 TaxID=3346675 RepID=UPI0036BA8C61
MDRIYVNRNHGERRIHIEIDEAEVADLLDDLCPLRADAFAATTRLIAILENAHCEFREARQGDARRADVSRT